MRKGTRGWGREEGNRREGGGERGREGKKMTLWSPDSGAALPSPPSTGHSSSVVFFWTLRTFPGPCTSCSSWFHGQLFPGKSVHSLARSPPCSELAAHTQLVVLSAQLSGCRGRGQTKTAALTVMLISSLPYISSI